MYMCLSINFNEKKDKNLIFMKARNSTVQNATLEKNKLKNYNISLHLMYLKFITKL